MLKNQAILEVEKNGKTYQLHLPDGCTLGEVHDVLFQMRSHVLERIQDALKVDAPKEVEQPQVEVIDGK